MIRSGLVTLCFVASVGSAVAVSPDPKSLAVPTSETLRAREFIRQLGSESYAEREQAQRALSRMGRLAKFALVEASTAVSDPEILRRVRVVMPMVIEADMKARVEVFLADTEGKFDHDFPGWSPYRKLVGVGPEARSLFAEMVKEPVNANLLAALEGPPEELAKRYSERRQTVWNMKYPRTPDMTPREPALADVVTLLLIDTLSPQKASGLSVGSMFQSVSFLTSNLSDARGEVVKTILNEWCLSRDDLSSLYSAMTIANRFDLKNASTCAAKLLAIPRVSSYYKAAAFATIARLGAREHLRALEGHLDDEQISTRMRAPDGGANEYIEIRVQDFALAAALMVTQQKPESYGFKGWSSPGTTTRSRYLPYYLPPEARVKAFEKWKAWRMANPDPKPKE